MVKITLDSPLKDMNKQIKKMPVRIFRKQQEGLFRIGNNMRNIAISYAPYKSGTLRRSITFFPYTQSAMTDFVQVGTNLDYARVQDQGGTIKPKTGKYLTIPIKKRGRIANYPKGFFVKSKKGNLIYARTKGKTKKLEPLFVLKKSVRIKGKPYLSRAFKVISRRGAARTFERVFKNVFR